MPVGATSSEWARDRTTRQANSLYYHIVLNRKNLGTEMNCIEKLKSKVIITWEMKSERLAILQNAVRDLDQAAT